MDDGNGLLVGWFGYSRFGGVGRLVCWLVLLLLVCWFISRFDLVVGLVFLSFDFCFVVVYFSMLVKVGLSSWLPIDTLALAAIIEHVRATHNTQPIMIGLSLITQGK